MPFLVSREDIIGYWDLEKNDDLQLFGGLCLVMREPSK